METAFEKWWNQFTERMYAARVRIEILPQSDGSYTITGYANGREWEASDIRREDEFLTGLYYVRSCLSTAVGSGSNGLPVEVLDHYRNVLRKPVHRFISRSTWRLIFNHDSWL